MSYTDHATTGSSNKRARTYDYNATDLPLPSIGLQNHIKTEEEDMLSEDAGVPQTGRRTLPIAFIEDHSRRRITFSKRKAGIIKKAHELATLTGTQALLLIVSESGLIFTFVTPKLEAFITQSEGKDLILRHLNAPSPLL